MKTILPFLTRWHRVFMVAGLAFAALTVCLMLSACNVPIWLTDAEALLPVIGSSVTSILSFMAALTGNAVLSAALAKISTIIADVGKGLNDLEAMIVAYKSNPTDTLMQKIEGLAQTISDNLNKVLSDTGLPIVIADQIKRWAQLALSQIELWMGVLPGLKAHVASGTLHAMAAPVHPAHLSAGELTDAFNAILDTKTGNVQVDAALAKAARVINPS